MTTPTLTGGMPDLPEHNHQGHIMTAQVKDAYQSVLNSIDADMLKLAERITASCAPDDDRLEIAYSIARRLNLGWPAADQGAAS